MDINDEKCAVCGEKISDKDEKIYCPDCGTAMHRECFRAAGKCPNETQHEHISEKNTTEKDNVMIDLGRDEDSDEVCDICGRPFKEDDEKVFCPDCGAAMHKLCYSMTHRCPHENEHSDRSNRDRLFLSHFADDRNICGKCGKNLTDEDEKVYCPECGTPVHKSCWESSPGCPNAYRHLSGYDWEADHSRKPTIRKDTTTSQEYGTRITFENFPDIVLEHPFRSQTGDEELTCRGVNQKELLYFLGKDNFSTPRFFMLFMNMANSGKILSFNFSAWLFAPFYHFYRRMTGPAVILTVALFILTLPTVLSQMIYWGFTDASAAGIINDQAAVLTSYILAGLRLCLLLFNDYFYMRWSVSRILSIREKCKDMPEDEYYEVLEHSGKPKMIYILACVGIFGLLGYAFKLFISASGIT